METAQKKAIGKYLAGFLPIVVLALAVFIFFMTEDERKEREKQKEELQYQTIVPEGKSFEAVKADKTAAEELLAQAGYDDIYLKQVLEVKNKEKQVVGFIYELCDASGYGGELTLLIGMNASDAICGIALKSAPNLVMSVTQKERTAFLEQFLYGHKDKAFWIDERIFGGIEVMEMEGAPVTSREIVRMVNCCRLLEENLTALTERR